MSILAVIAGHWFPLGPSNLQLNAAVAATGMALFFCLSGFLIAKLLYSTQSVSAFLIKRLFRIIPLAWTALCVLIVLRQPSTQEIIANALFYANLPPARLIEGGEHLWSLGVELQFYIVAALIVALCGRRGLLALPVLAIGVTILRIIDGEVISIVTWHRVDEILAGACVALIWIKWPPETDRSIPAWISPLALVMLVLVSLPQSGALGYLRPYVSAVAVGTSLYAFPGLLRPIWEGRIARYIAEISYALYVWHAILQSTPLGGEDKGTLEKYLLRIPLTGATWFIAHVSTRYLEAPLTQYGRKLAAR